MGMVDEMKSLRENIDIAQADRIECISNLRNETLNLQKEAQGMLKGFKKERKERANLLRKDLENYVVNIKKDVKGMLFDYTKQREDIAGDIKAMHEVWIGKKEKRKKTEEEEVVEKGKKKKGKKD